MGLRIIYIDQYFSQFSRPPCYHYAKKLVSCGHSVAVITGARPLAGMPISFWGGLRPWHKITVDGIQVLAVNLAFENRFGFLNRVFRFLAFMIISTLLSLFLKADCIFASSTPLTVGVPGIIAKRLRRIRFVFEVRDLWPESIEAMGVITNRFWLGLLEWLERSIYSASDRITVISDGIRDRLIRRGIPEEKIVVNRLGADLELIDSISSSQTVRQSGQNSTEFVAIYSGTLGPANGLQVVLSAAQLLPKRIRIIILGNGKQKSQLMEYVAKKRIENVLFLEALPKPRAMALVKEADCGLMILENIPLFQTASPNKFYDYLACGKPVVCNFPGEVQRLLTVNNAGLFAEPESGESLARSLQWLADHPTECTRMGENARQLAQRFSRDRSADQIRELVERVVLIREGATTIQA